MANKCSIGEILGSQNCYKVIKSARNKTTIQDIKILSKDQQDLLLFRTGLPRENITSVCPYHQFYYNVNNLNYFHG